MHHLLTLMDYSTEQIEELLEKAYDYKISWEYDQILKGQNIILYFEKPSLRTYLTFDIAIKNLGGNPIYFDNSRQMGRESDIDMIRNMSRWADGIVARVYKQSTIETFAKYGKIPVINALSDMFHPCQALADYMTMKEITGKDWEHLKVAYIGEPNNVSNSLMICGAKLGITFKICCPASVSPDYLLLKECQKINPNIKVSCFIEDIKNYDIIYTDTWLSMGDTTPMEEKIKLYKNYQVNQELLDKLDIPFVLHCLPCHRGQEITDEIMETHPEIYQQAENRLWTEMSLLSKIF